jgi:hypothetical protein
MNKLYQYKDLFIAELSELLYYNNGNIQLFTVLFPNSCDH